MGADEVLAEVESLSYSARCRRLAACRHDTARPELAAMLAELAERGPYERGVGLTIAAAARDEASLAYIERAAGDADADIAGRAIDLVARLGTDGAALERLAADGAVATRVSVYRAIRRWVRREQAERLIGEVAERWGDGEAASLRQSPNRSARPNPATVLPHAARLKAGGDLAGGLLARTLIATCGPRTGWAPPWRDLLQRLRHHAHPDVAYLATKTYTAQE